MLDRRFAPHHHVADGLLRDGQEGEGDADHGDDAGPVEQAAPGERNGQLDHLHEHQ